MKRIFYALVVLLLVSCQTKQKQEFALLEKSAFETEYEGQPTSLYTLDSGNGLVVQVTNFGLRVVSIWTPDKEGNYADVAIGYENIDRYLYNNGERFLGSIVGRYANRIAKGQFELDGEIYQLPINNNGQTLHGGLKGLDMLVWNVDNATDQSIDFSIVAKDGEDGFPGNVTDRKSVV